MKAEFIFYRDMIEDACFILSFKNKNMTTVKYLCLFLFLLPNVLVTGQEFWLTTNEFWGGPKTGITLLSNSDFLVSTTNSILRSSDEFNQLEQVLTASYVHTLFASTGGTIYAGGTGKIFFSDDLGASWDSVSVNTAYALKQIIENNQGDLFAITGVVDDGDGVFFSGDGGLNWEKRNTGLGSYLGCDKITVDKNGRLYLAISDENVFGNGGLFISENNGLQWTEVSVDIDTYNTSTRIGSTKSLTILTDDNLYMGFTGSASNFAVNLNIYKNIDEVTQSSAWNILDVAGSTVTAIDKPLNNIYISQNGDWYSSITQTITQGGTAYSKDGINWTILDYGLGADINNLRNEHFFAETSTGRIFMIQYLDERIYRTDQSVFTSTPKPTDFNASINLYPNPVVRGESFTLEMELVHSYADITVFDLTGNKLFNNITYTNQTIVPAPEKQGVYMVCIKNGAKEKTLKMVVK